MEINSGNCIQVILSACGFQGGRVTYVFTDVTIFGRSPMVDEQVLGALFTTFG